MLVGLLVLAAAISSKPFTLLPVSDQQTSQLTPCFQSLCHLSAASERKLRTSRTVYIIPPISVLFSFNLTSVPNHALSKLCTSCLQNDLSSSDASVPAFAPVLFHGILLWYFTPHHVPQKQRCGTLTSTSKCLPRSCHGPLHMMLLNFK